MQAVIPPPDGGYPNFTTAEGQNALFSLTSGAANTAVGWFSLKSVTTGSFNTGVGAGTLVLNAGPFTHTASAERADTDKINFLLALAAKTVSDSGRLEAGSGQIAFLPELSSPFSEVPP